MKRLIFTLVFPLMLASCFKQTQTVNGGGGSTTGDDGNGSTTSSGGTNGTNGTNGSNGSNGSNGTNGSTNGSTNGDDDYYPPAFTYNVRYAGGVAWYPRNNPESEASQCNSGTNTTYTSSQCLNANSALLSAGTPTTLDARAAFRTDSRYKVKITVNPKPNFDSYSGGQNATLEQKIYCYRRKLPGAQEPAVDNYTSLQMEVNLRRLTNCNSSGCQLGAIVATVNKTINVNSSDIIDFTYLKPASTEPFFVEIKDVRNHNGIGIRSLSCWGMKVEISTDFTRDLN